MSYVFDLDENRTLYFILAVLGLQ